MLNNVVVHVYQDAGRDEGEEGRDKSAMNNVLGKGRTTGWGPLCHSSSREARRVEESGDKAREEDTHSIVFLQKSAGGKQGLNFSELTS